MERAREGRIVLVRHGETEANLRRCFADSDDVPLTEAGRLQSRELAFRLAREFCPEVLVSSRFLRARETSEIIARVLGLATEAISGIHERDFGSLKGQPYERLGEAEDGESPDDVRRRAMAAIETLRTRYPGREVVIVTHGAVIQAVCAHITGDWSGAAVPPNCGIVTVDDWNAIPKRSSSSVPDRRQS
jgi:broad specificity phosphatase PhoE